MQMIFGMLRMGKLSVLMTETIISAFTTGVAVLVITSQIEDIFGIKLPHDGGTLQFFRVSIHLFKYYNLIK